MSDLIEVHTLRAFSANSANRDNNGNVKTVTVGGDQRLRYSSASRRHVIRELFTAKFKKTYHTRHIVDALMEHAEKAGYVKDENREKMIEMFTKLVVGIKEEDETSAKKDKKKSKTDDGDESQKKSEEKERLHVYSEAELDTIAKFVYENINEDVDAKLKDRLNKQMKTASVGAEIALFGRMIAGGVGDTVYSAAHTNHSYSIDDYWGEFDYFIASDNYCPNTGAGHIGHSSIASNTMYSYDNVSPVQVFKNLESALLNTDLKPEELEEQRKELKIFTRQIILEMIKDIMFIPPSGKQNVMASFPIPSAVYITVLQDGFSCTIDNAFNGVIRGGKHPVAVEGTKRIVDYIVHDEQQQDYSYRVFCTDSIAERAENKEYIGADRLDKAIQRKKV